jgi:hypothetical protein
VYINCSCWRGLNFRQVRGIYRLHRVEIGSKIFPNAQFNAECDCFHAQPLGKSDHSPLFIAQAEREYAEIYFQCPIHLEVSYLRHGLIRAFTNIKKATLFEELFWNVYVIYLFCFILVKQQNG